MLVLSFARYCGSTRYTEELSKWEPCSKDYKWLRQTCIKDEVQPGAGEDLSGERGSSRARGRVLQAWATAGRLAPAP